MNDYTSVLHIVKGFFEKIFTFLLGLIVRSKTGAQLLQTLHGLAQLFVRNGAGNPEMPLPCLAENASGNGQNMRLFQKQLAELLVRQAGFGNAGE